MIAKIIYNTSILTSIVLLSPKKGSRKLSRKLIKNWTVEEVLTIGVR
jgi:hypothetical protein